ncbi:MAG: hypothetical protein HY081_05695 [Gammaproteobacteria bacterium]|nr:hypothetical protein [Gammaproteobacteria bacterium]
MQIDKTYYTNAVHDNYLMLPLKPGEYTLEALHVYRSTEDRATTIYPLHYKFRIVSNQATNLGTITFLPLRNTPPAEGRYLKLLVNNNDDMSAYLRKQYPALTASLRPNAPVLASDVKFVDASLIETMRRDIAREAWLWMEEPNTTHYVGGEVGTIAKLLRDTRGKVAAIDVMESKTTSAMRSCSGHDDRFVCSSAEPALYFVKDGKIIKRPLPAPAKNVWVHTYPPHGLVLVDQNMTVYLSQNDGESWKKYVWYKKTDPLGYLARINFTNGKNGYYIYSTFTVDPLAPEVIYSEYAREGFTKVEIPKMSSWQRLLETAQGLLAGPHNTDSATENAKLYFRPTGRSEWQMRRLPGKRCFFLRHEKENSDNLLLQCDSKSFASVDSGASWTENAAVKN